MKSAAIAFSVVAGPLLLLGLREGGRLSDDLSLPAGALDRAIQASDSTTLVLLGTGTPRPTPDKMGPATAVVVGKRVFLFDAGVGVERRLAGAQLPTNGVTAAFITHLHSDHVLGLPDLIFSSWIFGRSKPFGLYGPPGLRDMVNHFYAALREDIRIRTTGLEHETPGGYRVTVHEIQPGVVYDSGGVRVRAFRVNHGAWRDAFGYRIDTPDRSIVISGDTRPSEELIKQATGVDILVHEVQFPGARAPSGRADVDWPRYVSEYHTTATQLGELAARANPRLLVISHNAQTAAADSIMIAVRRGFHGRVVMGKDLDRF
jgi:ribonuclease BN (tRNA processing enzyme)